MKVLIICVLVLIVASQAAFGSYEGRRNTAIALNLLTAGAVAAGQPGLAYGLGAASAYATGRAFSGCCGPYGRGYGYYGMPPIYPMPRPIYAAPAPVYVVPRPAYYAPPPVVCAPRPACISTCSSPRPIYCAPASSSYCRPAATVTYTKTVTVTYYR